MRRMIIGLAATATTLAAAPAAMAQPAVGIVGGGSNDALVQFDTATPGTISSSRAVTGLINGERLQGVDYRWIPSAANAAAGQTQGLYGLGVNGTAGHIYKIDAATAVATPVDPNATLALSATATSYGFDFNPAADLIRINNDSDQNLRVNPNTGVLAGTDTTLAPAAQFIGAAAYDRVNIAPTAPVTGSNTTLFVINAATDELAYQGGLNSTPSPNLGAINAIGPLGVNVDTGAPSNFDIGFDGEVLATLYVGGTPGLYSINKTTGAATAVGSTTSVLSGFAIVPGTVQFQTGLYANSEGSNATITVTRSGSTVGTSTVNFATAGGTADGNDYTPTSGTLSFGPGETVKSFPIEIKDDSIREGDETVGLSLSAAGTGIVLGNQAAATLTIIDNDGPVVPVPTPPTADTTAPTIKLSTVRSSYSLKAFKAGITVRVTTNERAELEATVSSRVTKATAARALAGKYNLELIGKTLGFGTGQRTIKLKPKSALVGTPKKSFKVRLKVVATDAAGNDRTTTKTITVKK